MQVENIVSLADPDKDLAGSTLHDAGIVLYFMSPDYAQKEAYLAALKKYYPAARLIGCTTGGEIADSEALLDAAVSAAIKLEHTKTKIAQTRVGDATQSFAAGKELAEQLNAPDLRFIFVLSDGLKVNGSELIRGIMEHVDPGVILTGGLAGDGRNFKQTAVGVDGLPQTEVIAVVGFYGEKLRVGYGTAGGFIKFGPTRTITKSAGNILYELDGKNALELYKKYLGEEAKNLPGSGQYFPLSVRPTIDSEHEIVRTLLGINEEEQSLLFVGDMQEGYSAQMMRGNTDNLVDGALQAAENALQRFDRPAVGDSLGLIVSCVGRNMLMGQHVSNETEAIKEVLGTIPLVGFYSYGEICNHSQTGKCGLHNQTMTITLLSEAA
jgi:hypothetical protein